MEVFTKICLWISLIGAFSWGLIGVFGLDLIALVFGTMSLFTRIIYIIVGLTAIWVALRELNLIPSQD